MYATESLNSHGENMTELAKVIIIYLSLLFCSYQRLPQTAPMHDLHRLFAMDHCLPVPRLFWCDAYTKRAITVNGNRISQGFDDENLRIINTTFTKA